jgi:hypothetical protein
LPNIAYARQETIIDFDLTVKHEKAKKIQRFQCLRAEYVAAVGNLSLQGYPDNLFFSIIQFMALQCRKVSVFLQTAFASYREAIIAFERVTKHLLNERCNASNAYVISRSSGKEIYRQRGYPDIAQFRSHHFSHLFDANVNNTLPNIANTLHETIIELDLILKHEAVQSCNTSIVYLELVGKLIDRGKLDVVDLVRTRQIHLAFL